MRREIVLSSSGYVIGEIFFITGLIKQSLNMPTVVPTHFVGVILMLIAVFFFIKEGMVPAKSNKKLLSSNVTYIYKLVLPITFLVGFMVFFGFNLILHNEKIFDSAIVILVLSLPLLAMSFFLNKVYYQTDIEKLKIIGFGKEHEVSKEEIVKLEKLLLIYRFIYKKNGKQYSIIFLPKIFDIFISFGAEPKYIQLIRQDIFGNN